MREFKYPVYVQRATHRKRPPGDTSKDFDRFFNWDYMGSAEFEFGTLARTMNNLMHDWMKEGKVWVPKKLKILVPDTNGVHLTKFQYTFWFVGPDKHETTAKQLIHDQLTDKKWMLHERSGITKESEKKDWDRTDSWFAIPAEISRGFVGHSQKWAHIDCKDRPFTFFTEKDAAKACLKGLDERQHRWEEES